MVKKNCPLSEDFVTQQTSTKCGPNICPSLEDFVTQRTSTKCGPNICPSLEDFVSQRTVTKCGREFFPTWKTGHAADPDQMWSIKCRRSKESSLRAKSWRKEKDIQQSDSDQGCQQAPKIRSDCVSRAQSQKNDANAFVTPQRNNNVVARTKMTPNDTGMCINVIKRSYMIYLRCLKIFCVRTLVFLVEVYEDSGVCLSRA